MTEVADFNPPVEVLPRLIDGLPQYWGAFERECIKDLLTARVEVGVERYGKPLSTFNGRSADQDAIEEALDLMLYLKQWEMESGKAGPDERGFDVHLLVHSAGELVRDILDVRDRKYE